MDIANLEFNMDYSMASDLREVPADVDEMHRGVKSLIHKAIDVNDELVRAKIYSHIGFYSRLILDLEQSQDYYEKSYALFEKHKKKLSCFSIKIQLAVTYVWMRKFSKADSFFNNALKICRESNAEQIGKFEGKILESYAKSKFEQRCVSLAKEMLAEALDLSVAKGDIDQINKSKKLLTIVSKAETISN